MSIQGIGLPVWVPGSVHTGGMESGGELTYIDVSIVCDGVGVCVALAAGWPGRGGEAEQEQEPGLHPALDHRACNTNIRN
jgi:hypothetical protein